MSLPQTADAVVVGSGAAGMCAAIALKKGGLEPVILEKTEYFGGSTAVSGGAVWVPGNHHGQAVGIADSREAVMTYLEAEVGEVLRREMVEAFLEQGPQAVRFLEAETEVKFAVRTLGPDYHPDQPGAALGGRVMDPLDYDARRLGPALERLRHPIAEFTILNGMMVGRADLAQLPKALKEAGAFVHAGKVVTRHLLDLVRYRRGTRSVLGNALAARLGKTVYDLGIPIVYGTSLSGLVRDTEGRVSSVEVQQAGQCATLRVRHGVLLAAGGFPQDRQRRHAMMEHAEQRHWSMSPAGNTGDSLRAAEQLGARVARDNHHPAFWSPVSRLPRADGTTATFPHLFLDRAKPGLIAIDDRGQRFVNESNSYHDFVAAMLQRMADGCRRFWLVADHTFVRRYGLGAVRPSPGRLAPFIRRGYLIRATDPADLASQLGVEAHRLADTLARYNRDARAGEDRDFAKGGNAYNRYLGDPENAPNPCLRPIIDAPFYAVEIHPGDIGTAAGVITDAQARVLDAEQRPIPGLWAAGNDMNSIMGGSYPGPGITLGPALTFGWISANSILLNAGKTPLSKP
ncbi:FAD-dependent oxidoreductase [Halomonas icarae]|uniref:FAD-dependent oxidoreductase n=1 Tax=Halomonas icarae TaxID=2691040 RepID=A0A7X4W2N8_9GAMM|nr:FAD-dependent oxidoreductase [Halomonas icarae]MDR5902993.1 FAD-dependent oxidoreductase [Halomonas icarae]NAW13568.1 FAD-dependent oxidoreductase [Halomonas icarae]